MYYVISSSAWLAPPHFENASATYGTVSRLIELKENPSSTTWFKDHKNVFTDPNLLGERDIISDEQEQQFIMHTYRPYKVLLIAFHLGLSLVTLFLLFPFLILDTYQRKKRN
jgi:hypothetical protein